MTFSRHHSHKPLIRAIQTICVYVTTDVTCYQAVHLMSVVTKCRLLIQWTRALTLSLPGVINISFLLTLSIHCQLDRS